MPHKTMMLHVHLSPAKDVVVTYPERVCLSLAVVFGPWCAMGSGGLWPPVRLHASVVLGHLRIVSSYESRAPTAVMLGEQNTRENQDLGHVGPEKLQDCLKMTPRCPEMGPCCSQCGSRMAPRWPMMAQAGPKMAPDSSKRVFRRLNMAST